MCSEESTTIFYPTQEEIVTIHDDIIEADEEASSGVINKGNIDFALQCIEHGHFGQKPETVHEKAIELLRLLSANHPFADGNKRTALNATWTFYALNGYYFDYGEEIEAILKLFAVMERMVDKDQAKEYFDDITYKPDDERVPGDLINLIHLQKWDEELHKRFVEIDNSILVDDKTLDQSREDFWELVDEFHDLVNEYRDLREGSEELPKDVLNHIEALEEQWEEVIEIIERLADVGDPEDSVEIRAEAEKHLKSYNSESE